MRVTRGKAGPILALAALLAVVLALVGTLPRSAAWAEEGDEPEGAYITLLTSSRLAPTVRYRMYKIFDADYSGNWINTETGMLYSDGVSWAQTYGQNTPAIVLSVLNTWRESEDGPVDYYEWLRDNGYLPSDFPAGLEPDATALEYAGYDTPGRVADYLNWRINKDMESGTTMYDPSREAYIPTSGAYSRNTLPDSFANTLAEEFAKSGVPVGYTNDNGQVCATEEGPGNENLLPEKYEDGYYVLVPYATTEQEYPPIYAPISAEGRVEIKLTVKGVQPTIVDKKVVRSKDHDWGLDVAWKDSKKHFVGSTTAYTSEKYTADDLTFDSHDSEIYPANSDLYPTPADWRQFVGIQSVAVGGNTSTFTFAVTYMIPDTVGQSDVFSFKVVDVLPPGLKYVENSVRPANDAYINHSVLTSIKTYNEATGEPFEDGNPRLIFDVTNVVKESIGYGDRLLTLLYDVQLTNEAGIGWDNRNVSSAHLEYNLNAASNPQPNEDGSYAGDAESVSVSASIVTYRIGIRFEDEETGEIIEDVPYPKDDDTNLDGTLHKGDHGAAYLSEHGSYDDGTGSHNKNLRFYEPYISDYMQQNGVTRAEAILRLQTERPDQLDARNRDIEGWWWSDAGVGPTAGVRYYEVGTGIVNNLPNMELFHYSIDLWPNPYPYEHPASDYKTTLGESWYRFDIRSELNEDGTGVATLAAEVDENHNWGNKPQITTDIATGEIRVVVPLHKRDFHELPLTGMTPNQTLTIAGLVLVVVGSGALVVYRRKTAQKAA